MLLSGVVSSLVKRKLNVSTSQTTRHYLFISFSKPHMCRYKVRSRDLLIAHYTKINLNNLKTQRKKIFLEERKKDDNKSYACREVGQSRSHGVVDEREAGWRTCVVDWVCPALASGEHIPSPQVVYRSSSQGASRRRAVVWERAVPGGCEHHKELQETRRLEGK